MIPSRNGCERPPASPPSNTPRKETSDRTGELERMSDAVSLGEAAVAIRTTRSHRQAAHNPAVVAPRRVKEAVDWVLVMEQIVKRLAIDEDLRRRKCGPGEHRARHAFESE